MSKKLSETRKLGEVKVSGKRLEEHLLWKGISLWEVIETDFVLWVRRVIRGDIANKIDDKLTQLIKRYLKKLIYFLRKTGREEPGGCDVALIPFTKTQVQVLEPIFRKIVEKGYPACFLRYDNLLNDLKRLFEGRGLPYRTLEHYSSKQTKKELKDFEKKVDRLWNLMLRDVSFRREAGFDRIGPVFYYYFRGRKRILEVVMYASLLESFLRAEKPRVVILPEDTSELGKISVKVSKKFSIPVLTVQHGLISESFPYRGRGESDVYAVWGPEFKKVMNKWGIPKKKIKVVGCPLYDVVKVKKSLKFYKKFGLDPSVKTMVFASQRIPERKKALEVLAEFVAKVKNVQLIDKLHPVESYRADLNEHLRYFKGKERVAIIRNEEKRMIELWPYCDILIGVDSTVLLEGMVMGKPVIVLNPAGRKLSLPYTKYGAIEVKNVRELMNVVKAILSGKDIMKKMEAGRKKLIKEYFYKMDGKASERIAGIIEELMGAP